MTEFRVTVEDLVTGEKQTMEISRGDYLLIPFAPCYLNHIQRSGNGTVQLSLKNHKPLGPARTVNPGGAS